MSESSDQFSFTGLKEVNTIEIMMRLQCSSRLLPQIGSGKRSPHDDAQSQQLFQKQHKHSRAAKGRDHDNNDVVVEDTGNTNKNDANQNNTSNPVNRQLHRFKNLGGQRKNPLISNKGFFRLVFPEDADPHHRVASLKQPNRTSF